MLKDYRASVLLHGDPQGAEPLRKAIAAYLNLERGAKVSADQILVLSSTRQALFLCAQLLADAGKPILMENPGYFGARKAFESAETRIVPIDVDADGIRTDLLRADRSGANCVYVTPSHQYPTGATLSLARRLELTGWAAEHGKWIIEDDYDSEFHYAGRPMACVQGLDRHRRTLYLGTFSKTLYPGLRMGYMALPRELVGAFACARSIMDGHTPQILQLTLARFMEDGHYNSHVRAMRKLYAGRRRRCSMRSAGISGIATAVRPPGGLQIPLPAGSGMGGGGNHPPGAAAGLRLPGLSRLYAGGEARQGWLLGYASLTAYEIEAAVLRLANALGRKPPGRGSARRGLSRAASAAPARRRLGGWRPRRGGPPCRRAHRPARPGSCRRFPGTRRDPCRARCRPRCPRGCPGYRGLGLVLGTAFLFSVMPTRSSACSATLPASPQGRRSITPRWQSVPPETMDKPPSDSRRHRRLRILDDGASVGAERRLQRLAQRHRLGSHHMHERSALLAGEDGRVDLAGDVVVVGQDQAAARAAQGLVRGGRGHVGVGMGEGRRRPRPVRRSAPCRP